MSFARQGRTVAVHFTGKLTDGRIFDSSAGGAAQEFQLGEGKLMAGLERAIADMSVGDKRTVHISCDEAFGPIRPNLRAPVPRSILPPDLEPQLGMSLELQVPHCDPVEVRIIGVSGAELTVDANHPLAGEDLTFDIELVAVC